MLGMLRALQEYLESTFGWDPRTAPGLPTLLLPGFMVEDGVLLQRDGSFSASWAFRGPDQIAWSDEEKDGFADLANRAFHFGSNWMIQVDAIRTAVEGYLPPAEFPDPVSQLVDEERRAQFEQPLARFHTERFITITHLPPLASDERLRGFIFQDKKALGPAARALERFRDRIEVFERVFGSLVTLTRLKEGGGDNQQLRLLRRLISGKDYPFCSEETPAGLNHLLGIDCVTGVKPVLDGLPGRGGKHLRVVALDGFPGTSLPETVDGLDMQPFEYRWSTRAMTLDGYEADQLWYRIEKEWRALKRRGLDKFRRTQHQRGEAHAEKVEGEAWQAQATAAEGRKQTAIYTSVFVVMDRDETAADHAAKSLQKSAQNRGLSVRMEEMNTFEAYLGSIAGDGYRDVRRGVVNTLNLAHLLPLASPWEGSRENPNDMMRGEPALMATITNGSTPFYLNIHTRGPSHTFIQGPSGAGKTTLLGMLAVQGLRYRGAQVVVFDRDYGLWALTQMLGGEHYDIAGRDSQVCFAPLTHLDSESDRAWTCEWIEGLCDLSRLVVDTGQRGLIASAIERMSHVPLDHRTLTDFVADVQDLKVREALEYYRGPLGFLFDAREDTFTTGRSGLICFETKQLLELGPRACLPALRYLFRRVDQGATGAPQFLILDEVWALLQHPTAGPKIGEWVRTRRKGNGVVVMATQELGDVTSSEQAQLILNNCGTKILLPNTEASAPANVPVYRSIGCNDQEIGLLARGAARQEYLVISQTGDNGRTGRRMVSMDLGPVALSVVGVEYESKKGKALRRLIASGREDWRTEWIRQQASAGWAEYFERLEEQALCAS
jgi:type IV secretion system protein VirB4